MKKTREKTRSKERTIDESNTRVYLVYPARENLFSSNLERGRLELLVTNLDKQTCFKFRRAREQNEKFSLFRQFQNLRDEMLIKRREKEKRKKKRVLERLWGSLKHSPRRMVKLSGSR